MRIASVLLTISFVAGTGVLSGADDNEPAPRKNFYGIPIPDKSVTQLGTSALDERTQVWKVAFSPDSSMVACAAGDYGRIRLFDARKGQLIHQLSQEASMGSLGLAFRPDGKTLLSMNRHEVYRFYDVESGIVRQELDNSDGRDHPFSTIQRVDVVVSPDGKLFASGCMDGSVRIWNCDDLALVEAKQIEFKTKYQVEQFPIAFSRDSKKLAVGSKSGDILVLDLPEKRWTEFQHSAHDGGIRQLIFADDDRVLVSSGSRKVLPRGLTSGIRIWSCADQSLLHELSFKKRGEGRAIAVSADGKQMFFSNEDKIEIRDISKFERTTVIEHPELASSEPEFARIQSLTPSPDGKLLAISDYERVRIWDLATRNPLNFDVPAHRSEVTWVQFSPDGTRLVANDSDGCMMLWDAATGERLREFKPPEGTRFDELSFLSGDGQTVVSISSSLPGVKPPSTSLVGLSAESGEIQFKVDLPTQFEGRFITASTDGENVAIVGEQSKVYVVSLSQRKIIAELDVDEGRTKAIALLAGNQLVRACSERTVTTWDLNAKRTLNEFNVDQHIGPIGNNPMAKLAIRGAEIAPKRAICVTFARGNDRLIAWDLKQGKNIKEFEIPGPRVCPLAISKDEKWLAAAWQPGDTAAPLMQRRSNETVFRIFDLDSGAVVKEIVRPGVFYTIQFSPDKTRLAACSDGVGTIVVWDLSKN